jgi:nucleotide-binding universal stress UspA family protein
MGLSGELTVRSGDGVEQVAALARWTDLVVVGASSPEGEKDDHPLDGGLRSILGRAPRPVLVVPGRPRSLEAAVLAYDGSPKAEEALFVATYAAQRWSLDLTVVTAHERERRGEQVLRRACRYLGDRGVEARAVASRGGAAEAILESAASADADLVIMGGYGYAPLLERVLGSTVDRLLRESPIPVLVCR